MLVPTDHSNLLLIHKSFKLYKRFHNKIENTEYDLTMAILGSNYTKPPTFVKNTDDGGQTVSLKLFQGANGHGMQSSAGSSLSYSNSINETVFEKSEVISNVGSMYKNFQTLPLAKVLFSTPDDSERFSMDAREEQGMQQAFLEKNTYRVRFCVLGV